MKIPTLKKYSFLEEPVLFFFFLLNETSKKKHLPVPRQKQTQILPQKLAKRSNHHNYYLFDGSPFSNICILSYVAIDVENLIDCVNI